METFWQDLKFGARVLWTNPGFTAVAVITLALAIGANTAIFSVVDAVLLKPLPYAEPDRLVFVYDVQPQVPKAPSSLPKFQDWQTRSQSFEVMAGYTGGSMNLTGSGEPERLVGVRITRDFLSVLQVQPILGRDFAPGEDGPGGSRVVILSHAMWQHRFGGDRNVLGRTLTLNGQAYTVIGVLPPEFVVSGRPEVWIPLIPDGWMSNRGSHFLTVIARLKPGVTLDAARGEMNTLAVALNEQNQTTHGIRVESYFEEVVGATRPRLLVLFGAVGFVLLIACANVANLLLARSTARQRELAVRTALGASQWRLMRQILTENLLLALLGGVLGVLLAKWGVTWLTASGDLPLPRSRGITVDGRVLMFAAGISAVTVAFFGGLPAWFASRVSLHSALKEGGRGESSGGRRGRLRAALVVSELALAIVLLTGAGLVLRSFTKMLNEPLGFDSEGVLTMRISLPAARYPDAARQAQFFRQTLERVRSLPGVEYAGVMNDPPLAGGNTNGGFKIEGRPPWRPGDEPLTELRIASEDSFRALGIPLVRGRHFAPTDIAGAPMVVIINETMAKRFWPDEDPIGKRMDPEWGAEGWREIVGIVGDTKHDSLEQPALAETYMPYQQQQANALTLLVRASGDAASLAPAIRREVLAIDPEQPVYNVRTMGELVRLSTMQRRLSTGLIGLFAALAMVLAAIGIYGVMAFAVTRRTQEIGIRMALGAQKGDVLRLVLRQGMTLAGVGIVLGLIGALGLTRFMTSLLYNIQPTDPTTFAAVALGLAAVTLLASYVPARRAARVEPTVALRYE